MEPNRTPDEVSVNSDIIRHAFTMHGVGFSSRLTKSQTVKNYRRNKDGVWESVIDGCNGPCAGWSNLDDLNWRLGGNKLSDDRLHSLAKSADRFMNCKFKPRYSSSVKLLRKQGRKICRGTLPTCVFEGCRRQAVVGPFINHCDLMMQMLRNEDSHVNGDEEELNSHVKQGNKKVVLSKDDN